MTPYPDPAFAQLVADDPVAAVGFVLHGAARQEEGPGGMTESIDRSTTMTSLNVEELTLAAGAHDPDDGEGCVMEWVSVAAGEEWSDTPSCTSPVIGSFLRSWNDSLPDGDRDQLKRYLPVIGPDGAVVAPGVMGTNTGPVDDEVRAWLATDWMVRVHTVAWLRLAGLTGQADRLASLPPVDAGTCPSILPALQAVSSDAAAARAAARDAARATAGAVLRPTVIELQESAHDLLARMIAVGQAA